ncbi:flagellar assembly protein FliW [Myxococcota bacterium]|nr:flagellar assembly protein FliW [Myxococcota bacterium]
MQIKTTRFGDVEVRDESFFTFPMGLLGFSKLKRFFVLDHKDDSPFKWLQSAEDPDLAFIISDPQFFKRDYHISVRRQELATIDPDSEDDLVVSVIMTVPQDPQQMSANLLAPLVFNMANRKGMQYVLTDSRFPVKYFVMKAWQSQLSEPPPSGGEVLRSISLR